MKRNKYDFINKALLESIAHITEMTQTDHPMASCCHHYLMALSLRWQNNIKKDLINTLSFKQRAAILRIKS